MVFDSPESNVISFHWALAKDYTALHTRLARRTQINPFFLCNTDDPCLTVGQAADVCLSGWPDGHLRSVAGKRVSGKAFQG